MMDQFLVWAVLLGGLSAASLPLGSALGLVWRPNNKTIGLLTAFGGGALIAALSVELVAPIAMHLLHAEGGEARREAEGHLIYMICGAAAGGLLFIALDQIINSKGGFLRNTAATISFIAYRKASRRRKLIQHLGSSELVRHVPLKFLEEVVDNIEQRSCTAGEQLFAEGAAGDVVYFIETGKVRISRKTEQVADLIAGDMFGEISIITGETRTATAVAKEDSQLLTIRKEDFDQWRQRSPEFNAATHTLAARRLSELAEQGRVSSEAELWIEQATSSLQESFVIPSDEELQKVSEEHGGAPMAIWLGILLDGIPESFVIGSALALSIGAAIAHGGQEAVLLGSIIPYTLVAGLFLANFPEAMSSSIGMRKQGWGRARVFLMWFSLMVVTSVGAGLGFWLGGAVGYEVIVAIEGLAAGAMLTMIAAAMIPEAVHMGGSSITGFGTLTGFLSAVSFKLLE